MCVTVLLFHKIPWDSVPLHDFVRVRVGGRTGCEGAVANQGLGDPKKKQRYNNIETCIIRGFLDNIYEPTIYYTCYILHYSLMSVHDDI